LRSFTEAGGRKEEWNREEDLDLIEKKRD